GRVRCGSALRHAEARGGSSAAVSEIHAAGHGGAVSAAAGADGTCVVPRVLREGRVCRVDPGGGRGLGTRISPTGGVPPARCPPIGGAGVWLDVAISRFPGALV